MFRFITQISKRLETNMIQNFQTPCVHELSDNVKDDYRKEKQKLEEVKFLSL